MQTNTMRNYVDLYDTVQQIRMQLNNRVNPNNSRNKGKNMDHLPSYEQEFVDFISNSVKDIERLEKAILNPKKPKDAGPGGMDEEGRMLYNPYIKGVIMDYPIYEWIVAQRGLAAVRACGLIGYIEDISKFDTVSKLWTYAGFGVMDVCQNCNKRVIDYNSRYEWIESTANRLKEQNDKKKDGKRENMETFKNKAEDMLCHCANPEPKRIGQRRIAGQLSNFNPALKKQVYLCVEQFVKQGDFYKQYYKECKENYMNRPDLKAEMEGRKGGISKGTAHIDAMARRKVAKLFLSHLWTEWRQLEGLPVTSPYAFGILGHKDYIEPPHSIANQNTT